MMGVCWLREQIVCLVGTDVKSMIENIMICTTAQKSNIT